MHETGACCRETASTHPAPGSAPSLPFTDVAYVQSRWLGWWRSEVQSAGRKISITKKPVLTSQFAHRIIFTACFFRFICSCNTKDPPAPACPSPRTITRYHPASKLTAPSQPAHQARRLPPPPPTPPSARPRRPPARVAPFPAPPRVSAQNANLPRNEAMSRKSPPV